MSKIKLGNAGCIQSYAMTSRYISTGCECIGADVGLILATMTMGGSNLYSLYPGKRCQHNTPLKAGPVAYILDNYKAEAIKVKGKADIKGWLDHILKGSVALVFFRKHGKLEATALDLYLTNKLWLGSSSPDQSNDGIVETADEMWVWHIGAVPAKAKAKSHHKPHQKSFVVF